MAKSKRRVSSLKPLEEDLESFERMPDTAQTLAPAYRLAFEDKDFLRRDDMRGSRLQLEYLKAELVLGQRGVNSTVIMFGGARIPEPGTEAQAQTDTGRDSLTKASKYYEEARKFAQTVSEFSMKSYGQEFVIVTGGGPGIMEAGNRGAHEVGANSIGLNIVLPHEHAPNSFVTPDLCFNFHYFAIRKMHFLMRAKAITIFPGGFGTLDELFETLTLIQTKRMQRMPILLFGREFWEKILNWDALADAGTISPGDIELFDYVETADEAWGKICEYYEIDPSKSYKPD